MIDGFLFVEYIFPSSASPRAHRTIPQRALDRRWRWWRRGGSSLGAKHGGFNCSAAEQQDNRLGTTEEGRMWETLYAEGLMNNASAPPFSSSHDDALKSTRSTGFPSSIDYIPFGKPTPEGLLL